MLTSACISTMTIYNVLTTHSGDSCIPKFSEYQCPFESPAYFRISLHALSVKELQFLFVWCVQAYSKHMQWFITAKTLLMDSHIMAFSRLMLIAIMEEPSCLEMTEVAMLSRLALFCAFLSYSVPSELVLVLVR